MYTRVNWQNAPSTATPVNAENLNTMDKGIADAHSQLAEKATKQDVANIVSGSPKGTFATLASLEATHPNGADGVYVVHADGHWYFWNGTTEEWVDGGVYQSDGIQDGSVSMEKLHDDVRNTISNKLSLQKMHHKNIFNGNFTQGKTLSFSTGLLVDAATSSTTDFVEVRPYSDVTINKHTYMAEYDEFKNFIPGTAKYSATNDPITVSLTAHTRYVRVAVATSLINSLQIEYGTAVTPYEAYKVPVLKGEKGEALSIDMVENIDLDFKIEVGGKNRFDKKNVVNDKILKENSDELVDGVGWTTSGFIPVKANTSIVINKARFVVEYDKHKRFIGGSFKDIQPQSSVVFTTSANTKYVRFTVYNTDVDTTQMEYGTIPTEYESAYYSVFYGDMKIYDLKGGSSMISDKKLIELPGYDEYVSREKYQIYKANGSEKVMAIHNDIAVKVNRISHGATISISTTGINGTYDKSVVFDETNFPNLIIYSSIEYIMIVPYTRNMTTSQTGKDYRIVVISNRGQVYHNFPSRGQESDGQSIEGDILRFDESVLWDLPERKYPSKNPSASGTERYMPGLPDERYEYFPPVNSNNGFGNGGFGKSITLGGVTYPRFYQPGRTWQTNSISPMGGYEPGDKITIIGTYKSNKSEAVRICVFVSDDGGRSWFNKYEFAVRKNLNTTPINTSLVSGSYVSNSLKVSKRNLIAPSASDKNPVNKFSWGSEVVISNITKGDTTKVTTGGPHNLTTGDIVAFKSNVGSSEFEWLVNDGVSPTSGGNGVLFGVKVINTSEFEIYEHVNSAFNNISCRHIHHINRIKDGWIIGTGEEYPDGFLFYMKLGLADNYSVKRAHENFLITRLTSTDNALQRSLGAIMFDDADSTMLVASDSAAIPRGLVTMPPDRGQSFSINSTGIFKVKLSDIDDIDKCEVVFEAKEPSYFFKEKGGALIFIGQRGEFGISFDKGQTWEVEDLRSLGEHFMGESKKVIVIDDFIIALK